MSLVKQLGYLVFEVSDLAAWEQFGTQILGLDLVDRRGDEGFSLRMDGYHQRFFIEQGPADDLAAIGWEVEGRAALEAFAQRFKEAGHEVSQRDSRGSRRPKRRGTHSVDDPAGNPIEIFYGPKRRRAVRLRSRRGRVRSGGARVRARGRRLERRRRNTKSSTRACSA